MNEPTMNLRGNQPRQLLPISVGMLAGAGIAVVDNFAFGGEISPIAIVGMLLIVAGAIGMIWGVRAVVATAIVWVWLPMAHVVKHAFNLPDTLHPNTYTSIFKLAAFSFVVSAIGYACGLALHSVLPGKQKTMSDDMRESAPW